MTALDTYQTSGFKLLSMAEHDLPEIVEIEELCGLSRWGREGYRDELSSEKEALMIVACLQVSGRDGRSERIAGFIAARMAADELHINNVAVREQYRRRGLGGALLSAALERGRHKGARRAFLEVRDGNLAAQALYSRHGFGVAGRRANYYSAPVEDALVMTVLL